MNQTTHNNQDTILSSSPLQTTLRVMFRARPLAAIFQVIAAALGIGLLSYEPILIKALFDSIAIEQYNAAHDKISHSTVLSSFLLVAFIWIAAFIVNIIQEIVERSLAPAAQKDIQNSLFQYAINQPTTFLNTKNVGFISQSIKQAGTAVSTLITLLSYDFVRLFVTTCMALYVSTKLPNTFFFIILIWTVAYYATCYWFAKKTFPKFKLFSNAGAKSAGTMGDILNNIDLVRAFSKTQDEIKFVGQELNTEKEAAEENRRYVILMNLIVYGGAILFQAIFVYYSIELFDKRVISLGDVALAITLAAILVNNASGLCRQLLSLFEQTGNLSNALDAAGHFAPNNITAYAEQKEIHSGKIKFQNVFFQYENGKTIFKDLNLDINHGEKVGIVGKSGSGKTTLIKLLTKRIDPSSGIITIDDTDINTISAECINKYISQVSQDVLFLHRTIAENLMYGCNTLSEQGITEALQKTQSINFVSSLPQGLNSIISQKGVQLSGGEKQRLAIVRALLKEANIIILDEATSAVDIETEERLFHQISNNFDDKTVLIVSHRISALKNMDKIIFIHDDATVSIGEHRALADNNKDYFKWTQLQTS